MTNRRPPREWELPLYPVDLQVEFGVCRCIPRLPDVAPQGIEGLLSRAEYLQGSGHSHLTPEARQKLIRVQEEMLREPIVVAMSASPSSEQTPPAFSPIYVKLPTPPPAPQAQTSRMDYLEIEGGL